MLSKAGVVVALMALLVSACDQPTAPQPKAKCVSSLTDSTNVKFVALVECQQRTDTLIIRH